nr:MAG TPA: hypothetical protein [Caudoviricetes sp.]
MRRSEHIVDADEMMRREEILCSKTTQPCRWQMK